MFQVPIAAWWWFAATATAGELAWATESVPDRSYKFEVYQFAPLGRDRTSSDWRPTDAELWSGILDCHRTESSVDHCSFRDKRLVFGFHLDADDAMHLFTLPMEAHLELKYASDGRVLKWDLQGERESFRQAMADAILQQFHDPEGRAYKPDDVRRIGQVIEQALVYMVIGCLELVLPDDSKRVAEDGVDVWSVSNAGYAARYSSMLSGATGVGGEIRRDGVIAVVGLQGETTESTAVSSKYSSLAFVDTESGTLVGQHISVAYTRQLEGRYSQRLLLLDTAKPFHTHSPGELAQNPLVEK